MHQQNLSPPSILSASTSAIPNALDSDAQPNVPAQLERSLSEERERAGVPFSFTPKMQDEQEKNNAEGGEKSLEGKWRLGGARALDSASRLGPQDRLTNGAVADRPLGCENGFDRRSQLCLDGRITVPGKYSVAGGGCADVWQGSFGTRTVAIKVVRRFNSTGGRIAHNKLLRRLWREYWAWSSLSHPNVLELLGFSYDFSPEEGFPSLISPWMANGTVTAYLENHNCSGPDRLEILLGVANGLHYLHTRIPPIVHGDLRAGNILVSDSGVPCLSDFGLSRVLDAARGMTTSSETGGSLRWMSPELLHESIGVSVHSDIWAYGMTFLEILSGQRPYSDVKSDILVLCNIKDGRIPSRSQVRGVLAVLSDEMWAICRHCWSLRPRQRPSMRELTVKLDAYRSRNDDDTFPSPYKYHRPIKPIVA